MIDSREHTELSDRIVTRATNKVAGVNALIDGLKFEITNTSSDDPDCVQLMKKLRVLHQDLATALDELLLAEQSIIDAAAATLQLKANAAREKTSQKKPRRSKQGSMIDKQYTDVLVDLTITSPAVARDVTNSDNESCDEHHHDNDNVISDKEK